MERLVASYRIGMHDVDVLESVDDEAAWFHLVVDGLSREATYPTPPTRDDVADFVLPRGVRRELPTGR